MYGCAPRIRKIILNNINEKDKNIRHIAIMHWGFEYNKLPMPYDISLAHEMIDRGYDLVIGHHPHVIQPTEKYKGKHIVYSLGNFYMGTHRKKYYELYNSPNVGRGISIVNTNDDIQFVEIISDMNNTIISEALDKEYFSQEVYQNPKYIKKVKEAANNFNPILTNNVVLNEMKIIVLRAIYATCVLIKGFRRIKIVDCFVMMIRNAMIHTK